MKHVVRRIREYNCSNMELALTATLNILNKGSHVTVYIIISRGVCVDSSSFVEDKANTDGQRLYGLKTAEQFVYVFVFDGLFAYPK